MPNYGEIGTAAIRITADGREFPRDLNRQIEPAAQKTGSQFSSKLGTVLKRGAQVAGIAVGSVFGLAITKGFQRLTAIDDARHKLLGLKMPAKTVAIVMKNALNSVLGTAYGLGEAATIASGLVAAGIKPGKDLEKILKTVADTASITGGSLEEIGVIWGQIAAKGKLQGDELLQLTQRGVPILSYLAKHFKITQGAAQEMVSKGKVDFATFATVMQANLGGAAKSSGASFTGAMRNVGAALSRLGAGLLGGVFAQMPAVFGDIIKVIDKITPKATAAGDWIGRKFKTVYTMVSDLWAGFTLPVGDDVGAPLEGLVLLGTKLRDLWIDIHDRMMVLINGIRGTIKGLGTDMGIWGWISGGATAVGGLSAALGTFLPLLARFGPMLLRGLISPLGLAGVAIAGLVGAFATGAAGPRDFEKMIEGITAQIGKFVDAIPGFVSKITTALPGILAKVIPAIIDVFASLATTLPGLIQTLIEPLLRAAISLFMALVQALSRVLPYIIRGIIDLVSAIVAMLPSLMPTLIAGFVQLLLGLVNAIVSVVPLVSAAIIDLVNALIKVLPPLIPVLVKAAITLFTGLVKALDQILPPLLDATIALIDALLAMLPTLIPMLIKAAIDLFMAIVKAIPIILPPLIDATVDLIDALIKYLPLIIPALIEGGIRLFMALVDALPLIIPSLIEGGIRVIFAVIKLLPTLIPLLMAAAVRLFMAIVQAVPRIIGALLAALGDLTSRAWKWLSGEFGKWVTGAAEWFGKIGRAISNVWSNLTGWLRGPIDTALRWVQTNLIDRFNGLMEKLGISWRIGRIWSAPIPLGLQASGPRQFASGHYGGGYTGSGDPRKPAGIVHGREWVLNAKSTAGLIRDYGVGFLRMLNGYAKGGWVSPVAAAVTFPFGARYRDGTMHHGVDYAVRSGTPVRAPYSGRVVRDGWDTGGFGVHLRLAHPNGLFSILGHLMRDYVKVGQWVEQGQLVALSDNTGNSTGPHLHWELRRILNSIASAINPFSMSSDVLASIKENLAGLLKSGINTIGSGLNWLSDHLGPMGRIVGGIGNKMLHFLGDKALDFLGFGETGGGGVRRATFDQGGLLRPGLTMAWNGTGQSERVVPPGGGYGPIIVNMTISVDDLAKMSKIGDFLEMLDRARVDARRTERSGSVSA